MRELVLYQCVTPYDILRNPSNYFVDEFSGQDRLVQDKPEIQTVEQIMNPDPITTTKDKTLVQAIRHMKQTKVDTLLVVNEEQVLEGFIDVAVIDQKRKKTTLVAEAFETEMFTVDRKSVV